MKKAFRAVAHFAFCAACALLWYSEAHAQSAPILSQVVTACGTPNSTYVVGRNMPETVDQNGNKCTNSTGTVTTTPLALTTTPTGSTVTTHGTFQSALASSATRKGCLLQNTSADTEYVFFGATGSATTSNSFQVSPNGGTINCATQSGGVLTDNIAITSKTTDGATYVVASQ